MKNYLNKLIIKRQDLKFLAEIIIQKRNIENYNNSGKIYVTKMGKIIQTILSISDLVRLILNKSEVHHRFQDHLIINEQINLDERI